MEIDNTIDQLLLSNHEKRQESFQKSLEPRWAIGGKARPVTPSYVLTTLLWLGAFVWCLTSKQIVTF